MSGGKAAGVGLDPAYVLHRRPYRNTSTLAELLTQEAGRIGVVARGARAARSRWRGVLEPFVPLRVSWRGRGELYTLIQIEEAGPRCPLPSRRLASAFYMNELVLRLTEREQPLPGLFTSYYRTLHALAQEREVEPPLRLFEYDLLDELGLTLCLVQDSTGEPVAAERTYSYNPDAGPVPTGSRVDNGGNLVSGRSLLAFAARDLSDPRTCREVKRVTRASLDRHLGGRRLHSRSLLRGRGAV